MRWVTTAIALAVSLPLVGCGRSEEPQYPHAAVVVYEPDGTDASIVGLRGISESFADGSLVLKTDDWFRFEDPETGFQCEFSWSFVGRRNDRDRYTFDFSKPSQREKTIDYDGSRVLLLEKSGYRLMIESRPEVYRQSTPPS